MNQSIQNIVQLPVIEIHSMVAFLLAKLFSGLDNPDCLDFPASRNTHLK